MSWKKPEDVRLPIKYKLNIIYRMIKHQIEVSEEFAIGVGLGSLLFFLQGIWYFILRHNSPANSDGVLALFGTICAAFFLGLITAASLVGIVGGIAMLEDKYGDEFRAKYNSREAAVKKALFEKIDKDLLGDDYEL
jgi:hypothetical protein